MCSFLCCLALSTIRPLLSSCSAPRCPHPPCAWFSDDIPIFHFIVQVRAVVRGLEAARDVSRTLIPALKTFRNNYIIFREEQPMVYRHSNETAVRIDGTLAAAARARAQADAIAAGLGARLGRLNFASLNAKPPEEPVCRNELPPDQLMRVWSPPHSSVRSTVHTEYYVL